MQVKTRKKRTPKSTEDKLLKEQKEANKTLKEIRDILNNMWREITPQKGE